MSREPQEPEEPEREPEEERSEAAAPRSLDPCAPPPDEGDAVRRRQQQFLGERAVRLGPAGPAEGEAVDDLRRMREYRRRQRHELETQRDEGADLGEDDPKPEG